MQLKFDGAVVTAGQFGGWMPIAAEKTAGGYEVAWKVDGADQFIVWQTDAQGNWLGQTAPMSGTNAALQVSELTFMQDLNNDGTLGLDTSALAAAVQPEWLH